MRVARALTRPLVLAALLAGLAGCSAKPQPQPQAGSSPAPIPTSALCDLITLQDYRDAGATVAASIGGGGSATTATCLYGTDLELVAQVLPSVENANAAYQALLQSGWFVENLQHNPVPGVDESTYGNGSESAAVLLRRQKLIIVVTMPGTNHEAPLVQLANKALSRATALGT
jgi:hypothetical protein